MPSSSEELTNNRFSSFLAGLFLLCAGTLMYEVVLTRLLSVTSWYYLAFVSVSMAMFGMTAGALALQIRPDLFLGRMPRRLSQSAFATAAAMPLSLVVMLSIPLDLSIALQTVFSFLLFAAVSSVPFFFSGVAVCISLTRSPFPLGRVYFTDLAGASLGCIGSVALMTLVDAPSAILLTAAILFVGAAAFGHYAGELRIRRHALYGAVVLIIAGAANASTLHGIQPIWSKGAIDRRSRILYEQWNAISKVRARLPEVTEPMVWGPSPKMPKTLIEQIALTIDDDAGTAITRFDGDLKKLDFLRYDVTSVAAQLRSGGTAAIIGVGGGRDVLACAAQRFSRIVGIEVNSAMVDITARKLDWFSGFSRIPGFSLHMEEGRSFLTRSGERFDLIQASLVDTWAATSAGAMTLSENALYTVDGWRVFYQHLKPGGVIAFSRWIAGPESTETPRLYAVARATLMAEGVSSPDAHIAIIQSGPVATLLASSRPFSPEDIRKLKSIIEEYSFQPLILPGEPILAPPFRPIAAARNLHELAALRASGDVDISPPFDVSPYFFNSVHIPNLISLFRKGETGSNVRAILFLLTFMLAAVVLVLAAVILPAALANSRAAATKPLVGSVVYFIAIGVGFILAEMAMMQQLSIFLGHPIYSMVVVLSGLILSAGAGSLASDRLRLNASWHSRLPAIASLLTILAYSQLVMPVVHSFVAAQLWQRVLISLALVLPCGFVLGFCFPVGMRWLRLLAQERNLPWMWALNGAAGTLGTFLAILISMDWSIGICVLTSAACYLLAGLAIPARPLSPAAG